MCQILCPWLSENFRKFFSPDFKPFSGHLWPIFTLRKGSSTKKHLKMTSKRFFDLVLDKSEMPKNWSVGKRFFDIKHLYDATFSVLNRSATKNWCWKISIWPQFYWNDHIFSLSDNPGHNILALLSKLRKYWKIRSDRKFSIFVKFDAKRKSFDLRHLLS